MAIFLTKIKGFRNCHCEPKAKQSCYFTEIVSVASLPCNDVIANSFWPKNSNLDFDYD